MAAIGAVSSVTSAGMGIWGSIEESQAQKRNAQFVAEQSEFNRQFAEENAKDAISRGEVDVNKIRTKAQLIRGSQRAAMAAQGIDIDTGSAADVVQDSENAAIEDIIATRNNAAREAFGFRAQAVQSSIAGKMAIASGQSAAANTLLTGGANFVRGMGTAAVQYGEYRRQSAQSEGKG